MAFECRDAANDRFVDVTCACGTDVMNDSCVTAIIWTGECLGVNRIYSTKEIPETLGVCLPQANSLPTALSGRRYVTVLMLTDIDACCKIQASQREREDKSIAG